MSSTYKPLFGNGDTTSWVPFTTPWTAPAECSHLYVANSIKPELGLIAFDTAYEKDLDAKVTCHPPEIMSVVDQKGKDDDEYTERLLLGPFKCPGNWFEAATHVVSETWTLTHCCPSGYDVLSSANGPEGVVDCFSAFETSRLTYAYSTGSSWEMTTSMTTPTAAGGLGLSGTTDYYAAAESPESQTRYTATAYSLIRGYNVATASPTSTKNSAPNAGGGLSTGAKAGIGVGVGVGVLALLGLLGFLYLVRRRRNTTEETQPGNNQAATDDPSELDGKGLSNQHELQAEGNASELGARSDGLPRRELEGVNDWPPVELSASK